MNITIKKADLNYLTDCKDALVHSDLGRNYFPNEEKAIASLQEGFAKDEIFIALDETDACLGFVQWIPNGAFHSYPYLHIIAVKEEYRGNGIGKALMKFFEDTVFAERPKAFLVVADFNPQAKKLYQQLGYKEVGVIPDLYKKGVTEYLMMKEKV
jgi:ribosomal protein S18 acetylase RimI-like enzyme